jgi:hypothetical protein
MCQSVGKYRCHDIGGLPDPHPGPWLSGCSACTGVSVKGKLVYWTAGVGVVHQPGGRPRFHIRWSRSVEG